MRLTSLFALVALIGIWNESAAQTTFDIDEPLDSIRAPYSSEVTYSGVIRMETINALTGKPDLTGTALKLPAINFITDKVLLFNLVGSKTVAATISGVRGTFTAVPAADSGWEQVAPWAVRKKFATLVSLPAGQFLGCRYDMPGQKISIESLAVTSWEAAVNMVSVVFGGPVQQAKITWVKVKGNLRCKVGMKAADIPAPVVAVPPPVVVPPVVPPVTPPGTSPDGASIPPLAQLVDETGAIWTQVGTHPLRNGAEVDASGSILVTIKAGIIYFKQGDTVNFRWLRWAGNGWAVSAAP